MFNKVLVANRGEIACRVIRSCQRLGVWTVAVYSEADKDALHVRMADEAYLLGPPPPSESYLNIVKIVEAAETSGADAIHPGYGFLSENAAFAVACRKAGIKFIGPSPDVMEKMGDKVMARKLAKKAGIPVIPGTNTAVGDRNALKQAKKLGFRSWSRPRPVAVASACRLSFPRTSFRPSLHEPGTRPRIPSAVAACTLKGI